MVSKNWKNLQLKKLTFLMRNCNLFVPGRLSYRRSLHPLATLQNLHYLHFCGSVWPSWIRIRISITDPDPACQNKCGFVRIRIQIWIRHTASEAWFSILNNLPCTILKIPLQTVTPPKKTGFNSSLFVSKRRLIPSPPL